MDDRIWNVCPVPSPVLQYLHSHERIFSMAKIFRSCYRAGQVTDYRDQHHHERLYNVYKKFYLLFSKLTVIYCYVNMHFFNWIRQKPLLRGIPGCYATSNLTGLRNRTGTIHGCLECRASPLLKLSKGRFAWESRFFRVMPSDCLEVSVFWPTTCSPDHFNSSFRQKKMQGVFVFLFYL